VASLVFKWRRKCSHMPLAIRLLKQILQDLASISNVHVLINFSSVEEQQSSMNNVNSRPSTRANNQLLQAFPTPVFVRMDYESMNGQCLVSKRLRPGSCLKVTYRVGYCAPMLTTAGQLPTFQLELVPVPERLQRYVLTGAKWILVSVITPGLAPLPKILETSSDSLDSLRSSNGVSS